MIRSLNNGRAGLTSYQQGIDVIANNIANINTTGYKTKSVVFSDMLSQNMKGASAGNELSSSTNPKQIGLGVRVAATRTAINKQGAMESSDNVFDMYLKGNSFFVVEKDGANGYTKSGIFGLDEGGNLVCRSSGYYVQGWTSLDGETVDTTTEPGILHLLDEENLKYYAEPSSQARLKGNLNPSDPSLYRDGRSASMSVVDENGATYTVQLTISSTADDEANAFELVMDRIEDAEGNELIFPEENLPIRMAFSAETGNILTVNGQAATTATLQIPPEIPGVGQLTIDLTQLTMRPEEGGLVAIPGGLDGSGAGKPLAGLRDYSVGQDGIIHGLYANGGSRVLGQIAVAQFQNPLGLAMDGDVYRQTVNSGENTLLTADNARSKIYNKMLESSNVDTAEEFTRMILMQRAFQANSKVIKTSDEMLTVAKDLKR